MRKYPRPGISHSAYQNISKIGVIDVRVT